ncbi:hypothetical protein CBS101457_005758 [Exobasidium rhododendri]|nr:hypothetical protein CBS101457_005758 [Exobasidium rhododendri]
MSQYLLSNRCQLQVEPGPPRKEVSVPLFAGTTDTASKEVHASPTVADSAFRMTKVKDLAEGRSTMASRWAVKPDEGKILNSKNFLTSFSGQESLKTRPNISNRGVSIDKALRGQVGDPPPGAAKDQQRYSKKTVGLKVKHVIPNDTYGLAPTMERSIHDGNDQYSRGVQKPLKSSGATSTALGIRCGQGEATTCSRVLQKLDLNEQTSRDYPPHLGQGRGRLKIHEDPRHYEDDGYGPLLANSEVHPVFQSSNQIDDSAGVYNCKSNTDYLLEAIARMERENRSLLP